MTDEIKDLKAQTRRKKITKKTFLETTNKFCPVWNPKNSLESGILPRKNALDFAQWNDLLNKNLQIHTVGELKDLTLHRTYGVKLP